LPWDVFEIMFFTTIIIWRNFVLDTSFDLNSFFSPILDLLPFFDNPFFTGLKMSKNVNVGIAENSFS